ncbi:histidine kinase [Marmoricola endophyticus]|uniref:Histidine kinase n=1 Tax=Marmoricola endophyticus TaxID=2040280 RepID=A0A917BSJ6_9ACTN|nr:ATP-binding protein [Marmoricola endophyticus]GGF55216.1 histidine kinase [Marmoricola endophyticus]
MPALPTTAVWVPRRARRDLDAAYVGGVAAGLARHLALPVLWVRAFFLLSTVVGGFGLLTYAALWLLLPAERHFGDVAPGLAAASRQGRRPGRGPRVLRDLGPLVAVAAVAAGLVLLLGSLIGVNLWPLVLAVVAVAVLWRQADEAQRERWRDSGVGPVRVALGGGGWASYARIGSGLVLLVGAIVLLLVRGGGVGVARDAAVAAVLGVGGVLLMVGPWLVRLSADLSEERAERVRSQERADVAAHLHDSVLQTLALIQRSADDPAQVARLARAQERDLRSWLFEEPEPAGESLAASLRRLAAEVEDAHGVAVEVVGVGERTLPEAARPLLLAAREAMVNAAVHSGAARVDVYAEAGPAHVEVFVRDRGTGFDPDGVPADRHGVRHSIVGRMERHGGTARVRSAPGQGTEVRLAVDLVEDDS